MKTEKTKEKGTINIKHLSISLILKLFSGLISTPPT